MSNTKYADEGTAAHSLASMCLLDERDAEAYIGRLIVCEDYEHAKLSPSGAKKWMTCPGSHGLEMLTKGEFEPRFFSLEVTDEMAEGVQCFLDMVRARVEARKLAGAAEVHLLIEQQLPIDHLTGEGIWSWLDNSGLPHECGKDEDHPDDAEYVPATGTGDVVIVSVWKDGTAFVDLIDLKFGMGVEVPVVEFEQVKVFGTGADAGFTVAKPNPQLMIYASGARRNLELSYDIRKFMLTIHQPRTAVEPRDWEISAEQLDNFEVKCAGAAKDALTAAEYIESWQNKDDCGWLVPGDHCKNSFCAARATCPALASFVERAIGDDFENLAAADAPPAVVADTREDAPDDSQELSLKMRATDIIEDWCKAVRGEVKRRLLSGTKVPFFKLVEGRRGPRDWSDEGAVTKLLKSFRLKLEQMFTFNLISPTAAEKLLKTKKPKQWKKLLDHITRSPAGKSVAPDSDKRAEITVTPTEDDFEDLASQPAEVLDGSDLAG